MPLLGFLVLTSVAGFCWWFMARRPEQWARWVEQENAFWLGKGLISATFAARMKRWETGKTLKILLAITTLAGIVGLGMTGYVAAKAIALEHRKLRMPYNPALVPRRVVRPATNQPPAKLTTNRPPTIRPTTNHPPTNHPAAKPGSVTK